MEGPRSVGAPRDSIGSQVVKVILLKDLPGTGKANTVMEVKEGHARNYLIPHGLAVEATEGAMRTLKERSRAAQERVTREREETEAQVKRLEGLVLEIRSKSGEGGKLFGSVTAQQIADALTGKGFAVSRKQVELDDAIKAEGFYKVPVRVRPGVVVRIDLNVIGGR
jgi:large subunit ribosomal protein L9